jgi:peptidoglycan-N-acetylglucosamine deacetylase
MRNIIGWMARPPLMVAFITLCLTSGAAASLGRPQPSGASPLAPAPHVKGAAVRVPGPDCSAVRCLALTFDDGPNEIVTPQILDILARQQVKATFFVIGLHVPGREAIVQREYREGHEIGNHTWSHPDLSKLSPEAVEDQLQMAQTAITAAGVPAPRVLRPPYGAIDDAVASHNRLTVVRWNVDPEDWKIQDPAKIQEHILTHARPGAIILLHDIYPTTAAALEPTIQALKQQQYQFVTASQMLDLSPGDQGQYFGR